MAKKSTKSPVNGKGERPPDGALPSSQVGTRPWMILDTETTGFETGPGLDEAIEVAFRVVTPDLELELCSGHHYIKPERPERGHLKSSTGKSAFEINRYPERIKEWNGAPSLAVVEAQLQEVVDRFKPIMLTQSHGYGFSDLAFLPGVRWSEPHVNARDVFMPLYAAGLVESYRLRHTAKLLGTLAKHEEQKHTALGDVDLLQATMREFMWRSRVGFLDLTASS